MIYVAAMTVQGADAAGPTAQGLAVRRAAHGLLSAVLDDGEMLTQAIARDDGPLARLDPSARAQAGRIAATTLRHLAPADAVVKPFLRKPPPPAVRHALRLAVVEHFALGTPAFAAVDGAASAIHAGRRTAGMTGLVNAVLRRAFEAGPAAWDSAPPQKLPGWLRGRVQSAYGRAVTEAIEAVHATEPPLDLTARGDPAELASNVGGTLLPTGSVRLDRHVQVSALPGYDTGAFWVQDAAAALPARVLAPRAGERVLDLCAAPGGKTLQCAAAGASVTALDISTRRLARLRENFARTDLSVEVVADDALAWAPDAPFDAILLDAPCSATGTIRRHPDLPFVKRSADLKALTALQAALFDRAAVMLRPGGRLVYCTCSLLPEEGEGIVAAARARHPDLAPDPVACDLPGLDPAWKVADGALRLRPDSWADRGGIDGFFIAAFRKSADTGGGAA